MSDPLADLSAQDVSIWLDDISRERLRTGNLQDLVDTMHVVGVTSNPTIFQKALEKGDAYDDQVRDLKVREIGIDGAIRYLMGYDIRWACDVLRPVYDRTDGKDGRVSIEVDPRLAHETTRTIAEAKGLWWLVDRPNVMIKIPATPAGIPAIAATLAACWLACVPVAVWAPAVKPDLVAIAFTVGAVLAAHARRRAGLAGVLIVLAVWSKPTAALPALALAIYLARGEPRKLVRYVVGLVATSAGMSVLAWSDPRLMFEHVVTWNALPWHADRAVLLAILFVIVFGIPSLLYALARPAAAPAAYFVAAIGIVLLGGREGASLNYVLDLVAATVVGLALIADRLPRPRFYALGIALQLVIALVLVDPFGLGSGRAINTGAWEPPARLSVVHGIAGDLLVEDSGLLVADGRSPRVDDLFLWSRLMERGSFLAGERLIAAVRTGEFDAVVSEVDLAGISTAPTYERERWHPSLVEAVLGRYRLSRQAEGLYVYERRSP